MMTDAMKFGPEWLRNLSQDGCSQPVISSTPRYQLAEHRYGREEMLALFDRSVRAPDTLASLPVLFVEKTQPPLALLQMTEEETRMWNRGINSDAVLRSTMKTPAGISGAPRGGRGGSMDRGRGRGRGSYHYPRGLSYEEPGEGGDLRTIRSGPEREGGGSSSVSYPRTMRPYDRTQGPGSERGWNERNGVDTGDWNGSTSPRKEYSSRFMGDSWRRHRGGGEEDDGWRSSGNRSGGSSYTMRSSSWRDGEKDGPETDRGGRGQGWDRSRGWDDGGVPPAHHPHRRPWDEDKLPEWAMENPSESGGSFDASGAFHGGGGVSDEDEVSGGRGSREQRARLLSEGNSGNRPQRRIAPLSRDNGLSRSTEEEPHRSEESGADRLVPTTTSLPISSNKSPPPTNIRETGKHTNPTRNSKTETSSVLNSTASAVTQPVSTVSNRKHSVPTSLNSQQVRKSSPEAVQVPTPSTTNSNNSVDARYSASSEDVADSVQKHQQIVRPVGRQKSEDDMERMQEVADDLVAKLMDDEEGHDKTMPSVDGLTGVASEKWFYRDPQGEVQGPFLAAEMAEWFRSGYFQVTLLVRRNCDDRYSELGDLINTWGRIPFLPGPSMPPLKAVAEPVSVVNPNMPAGISQDNLLVHQYQYMVQQNLMRQAAAMEAVMRKFTQSEQWNTLPPTEKQRLIVQHLAQQPMDPQIAPVAPLKNPVFQLISQMQQGKVASPVVPDSKISPTAIPSPPLDPLQQLIRDMGGLQATALGMQAPPPAAVPTATAPLGAPNLLHSAVGQNKNGSDPLQSLLQQMGTKVMKPQVDSVWGATAFNAQSWLQQMAPVPPAPPGQLTAASMWALHGSKDIKTEQQILEEQQMRVEEERRREEQRKQQEDAERKQKQLEEDLRKKEAEKKRLEEHMLQLEEERKKQEEELQRRKAEEERQKIAAEEERKRQEEAKRLEEEQRKKEEAAKRREEEKKRKEEEKERKRKLEEERKREEEEKKRQEEEQARKKQEEEEQARRLEQQRRQAEALRRLQQEQQQRAKAAPWSQQPTIPVCSGSLVDIQRQEKEKKERDAREKEQLQAIQQLQQKQQQEQAAAAAIAAAESNSRNIQLKWAEKKPTPTTKVKSLSEIQAEEQEQLAKQQERERQERAQQQKDVPLPATASIWGTASQSLSWSSGTNTTNSTPAWGGAGSGNGNFWEEPSPPAQKPAAKTSNKNKGPAPAPSGNKGGGKARSKKEEAVVLKLFEQNTKPVQPEFYHWCLETLKLFETSVDIPTFVEFLYLIESPCEVKEYVCSHFGDCKETQDFVRQYVERRSKWRSAQRAAQHEDDMYVPASAVNPLNTDFQEVKGKGKKTKKAKRFRVDNRILGFNVTAAQDRLNVGDRDYGEGI